MHRCRNSPHPSGKKNSTNASQEGQSPGICRDQFIDFLCNAKQQVPKGTPRIKGA